MTVGRVRSCLSSPHVLSHNKFLHLSMICVSRAFGNLGWLLFVGDVSWEGDDDMPNPGPSILGEWGQEHRAGMMVGLGHCMCPLTSPRAWDQCPSP